MEIIMNTVQIKPEIVNTPNGPRMSYRVIALIDGRKVVTVHSYHTDANQRAAWLVKNRICTEVG